MMCEMRRRKSEPTLFMHYEIQLYIYISHDYATINISRFHFHLPVISVRCVALYATPASHESHSTEQLP